MTLRPPIRLVRPADDVAVNATHRPSVRVKKAAAILDCDAGRIYHMLKTGDLEGHHQGSRGLRVFADSIRSYQESQRIVPTGEKRALKAEARKTPWRTPAHNEAVAFLRSQGIM